MRWGIAAVKVKFWGTRGSLAKPGPTTLRYGGNTSCVEVRSSAGSLVVLDCGTGAHELGLQLVAERGGAVDGHLLITHTHWDHIQGIPFFQPLFIPGSNWDIYGPRGVAQSLQTTLAGQMEHAYFPVTLDQFAASIRFHDLVEGVFAIGDIRIVARYLNHPALTLGYRLEVDGVSIVYCCDHEPHSHLMAAGTEPLTGMDRRYADFVAGADLVIHDSQYTASEYASKIGWGHSPVEYAVRVCRDAGVKQLLLTHYDPLRQDAAIDAILDEVRQGLRQCGSTLKVLGATEGMQLDLQGNGSWADKPESQFEAQTAIEKGSLNRPVFLHLFDDERAKLLSRALAAEGIPCHRFAEFAQLLRVARQQRPALIFLGHQLPQQNGLEQARAFRVSEQGARVHAPLVLVASSMSEAGGEASAVTDWLVAPFTLSRVRSKIRSWVLRAACRRVRSAVPEEGQQQVVRTGPGWSVAPAEELLDRLTRIAATACSVPIALLSLIAGEQKRINATVELTGYDAAAVLPFCRHVEQQGRELLLPDALHDERFADAPPLFSGLSVQAFAGVPLLLDDGRCIGSLSLIDTQPRNFTDDQLAMLHDLSHLALELIDRPDNDGLAL